MQITVRNARFQQWQALLSNRSKRSRAGEFLVHGVRPITLAADHGWPIHAVLHNRERACRSGLATSSTRNPTPSTSPWPVN